MKRLPLVIALALAVVLPGCTALGAGLGFAVSEPSREFVDTRQGPMLVEANRTPVAIGAVLGLAIDAILLTALVSGGKDSDFTYGSGEGGGRY